MIVAVLTADLLFPGARSLKDKRALLRGALDRIRAASRQLVRPVAILQDLQGPKIRTGPLHAGHAGVPLVAGDTLVITTEKETTVAEVNAALKTAANGPLKGVLEFCEAPLVSKDFNGNPASSIVDGLTTAVIGGNMVKVMSWYDNEWGYSNRIVDLVVFLIARGI